ncbi:MAG: NAD(P)-dependent oxidoreductase [SAR324 cluster bacterium]|nr:NAD(P)-dependent oxidoreductase [SAR324 cluster bacterium]
MKLDLHEILKEQLTDLWRGWEESSIFISGGTGFFGKWLLESHLWLGSELGLKTQVTVLSRNPEAFLKAHPQFKHPSIAFIQGDVRQEVSSTKSFDLVIHAATEASAKLNAEDPMLMMDVILEGTRNILDFAAKNKAKKFLNVSSGAVYGEQPQEINLIPETYQGAPDPTNLTTAYGNGKRTSELFGFIAAKQHSFDCVSARGFAFVGPYLPLDTHFAVGNFIGDSLKEKPIVIKGDGLAQRSYLYGEDLAIWLWTLLLQGATGEAYNLGSDQGVSITELATLVSESAPVKLPIEGPLAKANGDFRHKYLPSIEKARVLGLDVWTPLDLAVEKTYAWHKEQN